MSISPDRARGPKQPDLNWGPMGPKVPPLTVDSDSRAFRSDSLKQTVRTDSGQNKAAGGFSISGFLNRFKVGDVVEIDGPLSYNGLGRIQRLTNDHLKLDYNVKGDKGTIEVKRLEGDRYEMNFGGERITTRYRWNGKSVVLTDEKDSSRRFELTMNGKELILNPIGFGVPGTIDLTVRK